jgi:FkbM family methyltransferase
MKERSNDAANIHQDILEYLRKIALRLDELTVLQRAALLGDEQIFEFLFRDQKIRFFLPFAAADLIQHHILRARTFYEARQLERFRRFIPDSAFIIDAGANIGNHSVYFGKICRAREIHAFEPMRETFKILFKNRELNEMSNLHCYNLALGSSAGNADLLRYGAGNTGATRLKIDGRGLYEIRSLDHFEFQNVDIVKMDVEGAQLSVIDGALETLRRCKPIIWIELLKDDLKEGDDKLRSIGYEQLEALSGTDFVYRARGR